MSKCFHLDIVSVEEEIYSGLSQRLVVTGVMGELEVLYNHAPLLTELSPGPVWVIKEDGTEEGFVIPGGVLEVQPDVVIVLANAVVRAADIDEAAVQEAKSHVEQDLVDHQEDFDYAKARSELAMAVAQLRVIQRLRKNIR